MGQFVTHLEAAIDGTRLPKDQLLTMHKDRPLWVRYDLEAVREATSPEQWAQRPATMWRYDELLPVPRAEQRVSLGEGITPLLRCPRLGAELGLEQLWVKDEAHLPTGSFKSRGQAMAISMARHFGVKRVAIPTAGNAGGAMAAYAARAGMEAWVFMPEDTPQVNVAEAVLAGARVFLVRGVITDCGRLVRQGMEAMGWFDVSTLKEPYRLEGKKTMGLELAEQFQWELPDVILYPTGGGTGLIGMWKAFQELRELGFLRSEQMPRMVAVQSAGCAPIVRAFERGERFAEPFPNPHTVASGIRVPAAVGDFMMLDVLRESDGRAVAVPDEEILPWTARATAAEGISFCPEAGACVAALRRLVDEGWVEPQQRVVVFNTAGSQKYAHLVPLDGLPRLEPDQQVDWDRLAAAAPQTPKP